MNKELVATSPMAHLKIGIKILAAVRAGLARPHMTDLIPAWVDGFLAPVDKLKVHQRGLRHKAVSVFLLAGNKVLLQQRALSKYHTPGLWANTCCTHPNWDETPADCAVRRLEQELGITGLPLAHRGQVEYRTEVGGGLTEHELVDVYVGQASETLPLSLNPTEVMATRWADLDTLAAEISNVSEAFTPWLRIYLAEHRDQILGGLVRV